MAQFIVYIRDDCGACMHWKKFFTRVPEAAQRLFIFKEAKDGDNVTHVPAIDFVQGDQPRAYGKDAFVVLSQFLPPDAAREMMVPPSQPAPPAAPLASAKAWDRFMGWFSLRKLLIIGLLVGVGVLLLRKVFVHGVVVSQ